MSPFRIEIRTHCVASMETLLANAAANAHWPRVHKSAPHGRRLAVVGGGPLVVQDLDELRAWDGDIWGINHTAQWLNERGVRAILYSIDPLPMQTSAPEALLANVCDPALARSFAGRLRMFDMAETHPDGIDGGLPGGGITSAIRAPALAFYLGYLDVSLFGCEGSFGATDHVDRNDDDAFQLIIRAGGADYRTTPGFLAQCEQLSMLFRTLTAAFHNRSGGLLKAMIENPDTWEVVAVSAAMKRHLEEVNGHQGMYEQPYVAAA